MCTVGRAELSFATGAQSKPLGGQLEVIGTEIPHVLVGGWAIAHWG